MTIITTNKVTNSLCNALETQVKSLNLAINHGRDLQQCIELRNQIVISFSVMLDEFYNNKLISTNEYNKVDLLLKTVMATKI